MASPASGVTNASSSNIEKTQGQNSDVRLTLESWLVSALSTLLDSVPSSPALASENSFISRTLEWDPSFRTGQNIIHGPNTTIGGHSCYGGILFMSFLLGLGAVSGF